MWIIATILGIILGIFLLLFILLLIVPIDLVFSVEKDANFRSRVRVQWMFGLIGKDIRRKKKEPEEEEKKRRKILKAFTTVKSKASGISRPGNLFGKRKTRVFLAVIRTRGFLRKVIKLVLNLFKHLQIKNLRLNLKLGLDDPADTGMLFGAINPAMLIARSYTPLNIQVEPDFEHESLQGYAGGELRVVPIRFARPLAGFIFSLTTARAIKSAILAAIRK